MPRSLVISLFLLLSSPLSAQYFLNRSAVQTNDSCFQLTSEREFDVGSIWFPEKVDLRNNFDLIMDMFFGCQDLNGADGIVFGLQPVSASVGQAGEGLGIGGVQPSLGVEFDTYQNPNRSDPFFDHVAIMANGNVTHQGPDNLAGPVQADANTPNIENCRFLPLRVTWDASSFTLKVYFNCELRREYTGDIVNDIFGGDPFVFYGFAAATGGLFNRQEVCFRFNSFLKELEDVTMCPGGQVLLDVAGGASYVWEPSEGLDDPTAPSVVASPDTTTVYTVKVFDDCNLPLADTVRIAVEGDSAFVNLGPDTTICPQSLLTLDVTTPTAIYEWSNPGLSGPVVRVGDVGTYEVTVTRQDIICEASDRITIDHVPTPSLELGPDTVLCQGEALLITADISTDEETFLERSFAEPLAFDSLYITQPGRYNAFIETVCGTLVDRIDVDFENCRKIYLPNAFSPNGDGINDRWFPQDDGDVEVIHRLIIFSRWGEQLYEALELEPNRADLGWDGELNGRPMPPGVYVWAIDATYRDGVRGTMEGSLQLVR
ncbi:MAG: T9SS type B sorting domain-containing protein [Bacteroidota bacterium]